MEDIHNQAWHDERRKSIGGSDAAVVCGVAPWKTALELYHEKRGELEPRPINEDIAYWGHALEGLIADKYADETGHYTIVDKERKVHPDYPFIACELDRVLYADSDRIDARPGVLECKTSGQYMAKEWGPSGTDQFPHTYMIQVQHQLAVTGYPWGALAVLIGGRDFRIYPIIRDDELIASIVALEVAFWDNVTSGTPPEPDFEHASTSGLLKRLFVGTNGQSVTLPDEALNWHKVKADAEKQVKTYKAIVDGAKAHIAHLIGENAQGVLSDGSAYTRSEVAAQKFEVNKAPYVVMRHVKKAKKL